MTAKQTSIEKYVVKLSGEERDRLDTLIRVGNHPIRPIVGPDETSKQLRAA